MPSSPRSPRPAPRAGGHAARRGSWWATEVCVGKGAVQYHPMEHEVGQQIVLGRTDAGATALANARGVRRLAADHMPAGLAGPPPAVYEEVLGRGDSCDGPGGKRRFARTGRVQWACAPDGYTRVLVKEPRDCVYLLLVFAPELCRDQPHGRQTEGTKKEGGR